MYAGFWFLMYSVSLAVVYLTVTHNEHRKILPHKLNISAMPVAHNVSCVIHPELVERAGLVRFCGLVGTVKGLLLGVFRLR